MIRGELSNLANRTHLRERYIFTSSYNYGIKPKKNFGAEKVGTGATARYSSLVGSRGCELGLTAGAFRRTVDVHGTS